MSIAKINQSEFLKVAWAIELIELPQGLCERLGKKFS